MARLNKDLIAMNVLTCATSKEAAEKSGISITTLYRLKNEDDFKTILEKKRKEIFGDAIQKATGFCLNALEVLNEVMNNKSATDSSRVSAARTILDMGLNCNELEREDEKMKRGIEVEISAYLRLAELCGVGDDEKRTEYMQKVEELLKSKERKNK